MARQGMANGFPGNRWERIDDNFEELYTALSLDITEDDAVDTRLTTAEAAIVVAESDIDDLEAADTVNVADIVALQGARGVATMTAASAAIIVAHGLSGTPTDVQVTPRETIDSASYWWVDTIGATNFTIHTHSIVTADADFGWRAELAVPA